MTRRMAGAWLGLFLAVPGAGAREVHLTLLHTSDLHGHVLPTIIKDQPDQGGLAKAATLIKSIRRETPNVLLIDSGDTIQGSEMAFYFNYHPFREGNLRRPHPMILAMNHLGYAAAALGNHDFNFGPVVLKSRIAESSFPWLSSNIWWSGEESPFAVQGTPAPARVWAPYRVVEVDGVRVGILGAVTPNIPEWEQPEFIQGLRFSNVVDEAKTLVPILKEREKVDLVVIAVHAGLEEGGGSSWENPVGPLATDTTGVDVILSGHKHVDIPEKLINGVLITAPYKWGLRLGRVDLTLEGETGKGFRVISKRSRTLSTDGVAPDPDIMAMMAPYRKVMDEYLGKVIGQAAGDFPATDGRRKETALSDLTLRVLCETAGTDIALHDVWALDKHLKAGPITIGDVFRVYFYEDVIYLVELTGRRLKDALEYSASLWGGRKDYTFDAAAGVTYTMDVTRPVGDRIVGLAYRGKPVEPDQKLRVAINSYQAQGGGGYTMFKDAPLLNNTRTWVREAVIDYITRAKTIAPVTDGNWTVVESSAGSPRPR